MDAACIAPSFFSPDANQTPRSAFALVDPNDPGGSAIDMNSWTRCFVVAVTLMGLGVVSLILIASPDGPDIARGSGAANAVPIAAVDGGRATGGPAGDRKRSEMVPPK